MCVVCMCVSLCVCVCGTGHLWEHFRGALGYDPARNLVWDQCVASSQVTEDLQSDQVSLSCLESDVRLCVTFRHLHRGLCVF